MSTLTLIDRHIIGSSIITTMKWCRKSRDSLKSITSGLNRGDRHVSAMKKLISDRHDDKKSLIWYESYHFLYKSIKKIYIKKLCNMFSPISSDQAFVVSHWKWQVKARRATSTVNWYRRPSHEMAYKLNRYYKSHTMHDVTPPTVKQMKHWIHKSIVCKYWRIAVYMSNVAWHFIGSNYRLIGKRIRTVIGKTILLF